MIGERFDDFREERPRGSDGPAAVGGKRIADQRVT
jgi:hypothetical protein